MTNKERQKSLDKNKWLLSEKQREDMSGAMLYCDACEKQRRGRFCGTTQEERESQCLCAKAYNRKTYENQKQVEDTCRAMIASYTQNKLVYEQYKDSEATEERSWANNAKIRANRTAETYNNYILKNSYLWKGNVPSDIYMNLAYLE